MRVRGGAAGMAAALVMGWSLMGAVPALQAQAATDQDKTFLTALDKDSNYEIGLSKLALAKSKSADVRAYALMVIHDHTRLKQELALADKAAGTAGPDATSMGAGDRTTYEALKVLTGETFDKEYIQRMVKGNDEIESEEKSESADSQLPLVKKLAQHSAAIDQKHAAKAKALAAAHGVS